MADDDVVGHATVRGGPVEDECWIEVRVAVPLANAEAVAGALGVLSSGGASIEHTLLSDNHHDFEYRFDPASPAEVRVWLEPRSFAVDAVPDARAAVDEMLATLLLPTDVKPELLIVDLPNWAEEWRSFYRPLRVGSRLLICPPWEPAVSKPGEVGIVLDPGQAFGTGQHESTRLCLTALERQLVAGDDVIDLGTGSGILAVAAARLGAGSVRALDVDAGALAVARESAARNGVAAIVVAAVGSLDATWPWCLPAANSADLLLANISQPVLCEFASRLAESLRPGGVLIAAGYLARDEPAVGAALHSVGLRTLRVEVEGEWHCHVAVATHVPLAY